MHARVAFYTSKTGSFDEVIRVVKAPGGLLGIFRSQPGFQSYEVIETASGLVSVSHWNSSKDADEAQRVAAAWGAEHIDSLVRLQQSDVGGSRAVHRGPARADRLTDYTDDSVGSAR